MFPARRHPRLKTDHSLLIENTNLRLLLVHINADKVSSVSRYLERMDSGE